MYTSHHYNVDPSNPRFKKTEAFDEIVRTKRQKYEGKEEKRQISNTKDIEKLIHNVKFKSKKLHKKFKES